MMKKKKSTWVKASKERACSMASSQYCVHLGIIQL